MFSGGKYNIPFPGRAGGMFNPSFNPSFITNFVATFDRSRLDTMWQEEAGTTPAEVGSPVGKADSLSGSVTASQATLAARPPLVAVDGVNVLSSDFVDDNLPMTLPAGTYDAWINTPYGHYRSQTNGGVSRQPLGYSSQLHYFSDKITDAQDAKLSHHMGTDRKYMIAVCNSTTVSNLRIYTGGAVTDLLFIGANGVSVTKPLSANSNSTFDLSTDGLTAPVVMVVPDSLINNADLTVLFVAANQFTGSMPSLSSNVDLRWCFFNNNQFTGSMPSLSSNVALVQLRAHANLHTGSIPSLSANTALTVFWCHNNLLTGYEGGGVSATLGNFQAQNNLLSVEAVDLILSDFVAAGRTSADGVVNLTLGGTGNATPSTAGIADKDILISRGWTVTTN